MTLPAIHNSHSLGANTFSSGNRPSLRALKVMRSARTMRASEDSEWGVSKESGEPTNLVVMTSKILQSPPLMVAIAIAGFGGASVLLSDNWGTPVKLLAGALTLGAVGLTGAVVYTVVKCGSKSNGCRVGRDFVIGG
jgi:hypothetical protein